MIARQLYKLSDLYVDDLTLPDEAVARMHSELGAAAHTLKVEQSADFDGSIASRIYAEAGTRLLERLDGAHVALSLANCCPPELHDTHGPVTLRGRALIKLKLKERLAAEVQRLLALEPHDPVRDKVAIGLARRGQVMHRIEPVGFRLHDELWGPVGASWLETLNTLPTEDFEALFSNGFIAYLCKIRQSDPGAGPEIKRHLAWAQAEYSYFKYMTRSQHDQASKAQNSPSLSDINAMWPDVWSEFGRLRQEGDASLLVGLVQQRKGIVVLQSHSGRRGLVSSTLVKLNAGLTLVGKYANRHDSENGAHLATANAAQLPFEFLKLAKLHRKEPRITRIFPDGGDGREFRDIELFGVKVSIGMGGSLLAYYGKSRLVFAKTRWTGAGWQVDFDIGPDMALAKSLQEADGIFLDYYAGNLRKILLGPVIDIGGLGGFVAMLRQALR